MDSNFVGLDLPGAEVPLAPGALQTDGAHKTALLEHAFDASSHAWLANIVMRLQPLRSTVASNICAVAAKHKGPVGDLDQRVSAALGHLLLQVSQAVCQTEIVLLQGMQLGVVREETVLRLEQLCVDFGNRGSDLVEVSNAERSLSDLLGSIDGCDSSRNQ